MHDSAADTRQYMKPAFEQIGPEVNFGDVRIDNKQAELFRQNALQGTKIRTLSVEDHYSYLLTSAYATGILSTASADYDVPESAFFSKNFKGANPDYWRSVVTFVRYTQKHADTKIYNAYEVESHGGEVVSAVRRVRIIRNLSRLTFNQAGEPYEDEYSLQRKSFQVPMQPGDVEAIATGMKRIMNRQRVTTR